MSEKKTTKKSRQPHLTTRTPRAFNPNTGLDQITLLGSKLKANYLRNCVQANVNLSTTQASQLSMTFSDNDFELMDEGLLVPDVRVDIGDLTLTIAGVSTNAVGNGEGITVTARPLVIRKLKNARGPKVMKNVSPSQFVKAECNRLKIPSIVQGSQKRRAVARDMRKAGEDYSQRSGNQPPSSWTTFQRLAGECGFICYEAHGVLYFGQPTWLTKRSRNDAFVVRWKQGPIWQRVDTVPLCTQSLDSTDKQVSVSVPMERWRECIPGRAMKLFGVPFFDDDVYMINDVSFDLNGSTPYIAVTASIPINPEKVQRMTPIRGNGGLSPGKLGPSPYHAGSRGGGGSGNYAGVGYQTTVSNTSLRSLLRWAGFSGTALNVAVAIVIAESGGRAKAVGDKALANSKWGPSIGLFQIRSLRNPARYGGLDKYRVASKLFNPMYNAALAYRLYKAGGFGAWSTYKSGAYKRHLGKDMRIVGWTPPKPKPRPSGGSLGANRVGDRRASTFVKLALAQAGDRYIWGAEASSSNPNPSAFDCSELVEWASRRAGVPFVDGSSNQIARARPISLSQAIRTRGAILWHPGHIAISLGNGRTIEAANSRVGVVSYSASGRFSRGGLIPGMRYGV